MNKIVCVYHAQCCDGFAAAWVVYDHFKLSMDNPFIEFIAMDYGVGDYVKLVGNRFDDADVYIVDFSIEPNQLNQLAKRANQITMIDHHKTAIAKWDGVDQSPSVELVFDTNYAGSELTWRYFNANQPVPLAIRCVADRDLWKFKLAFTKANHHYIRSKPWLREQNFPAFGEYVRKLDKDQTFQDAVTSIGHSIMASRIELIHDILHTSANLVAFPNLSGPVPVAAIPKALHSEAGEILNQLYPNTPFSLTYSDMCHRGMREYSFRSQSGKLNVRVIAEALGGGGHDAASGVAVPMGNDDMFHFMWNYFDQHGSTIPKIE